MAGILYDARRIKAYERLLALGETAGETRQWCEALWEELVFDSELTDELVFYLEHHSLRDKVHCEGYGLTDLYIWQMNRYNLIKDTGKNSRTCNKEKMAMQAFRTMADMKKEPSRYEKKLAEDSGMDRT